MKTLKLLLFCLPIILWAHTSCKNNPTFKPAPPSTDTTVHETPKPPPVKAPALKFKSYCNARFGYCVDYPKDILYPQGESENGDGQVFKSKDAENMMMIYRDFRDHVDPEHPLTLAEAYDEDSRGNDPEKPKRVISYKKISDGSYTVSGYNDGKIFYQKTILLDGQLVTCLLEYQESNRKLFDPIVERMVKSFK